ncbi:Divergent AAA domain [Mycolicibacterium phlei]|uniref:AlbA family DNA-binding domain-containing protein n=1 Tax=Mycobacteroides chelonae TaxID=1774 RepID=UPI00061960FC|nr:ATP-binding protein [Mycobacteroides chelonae]ANA98971.1 hypothetical protein BB28_15150 [Mycobacteroides chelonae CCUG 47445]OLT72707.1 hypothetical protein BKG56_22240 [Mycobacteroides chelonae]VEG17915.1 Divergent AAA domain [Mycolicibacterium phlei]
METPGNIWNLRTEEEIRGAAESGLLEETHYLDLKREVAKGDSANKGLAKDIAAFALDGGTILIGVDEDTVPPSLHPNDLSGLPERVEQIARLKVDEPVMLSATCIPSAEDSGRGYLVVHVPPSPRAPHMADGRYYGRGDKTNRQLPNAEVVRLHEMRVAEQDDILLKARNAMLAEASGATTDSDLMMVRAEPVGARSEFLVPLSDDQNWEKTVLRLTTGAAIPEIQNFAPTLRRPSTFLRRAGGVSCSVGMFGGERFVGGGDAAELVFNESGTIALMLERTVVSPNPSITVAFETMIIGHIDLLVRLLRLIADEFNFHGSWRIALVVWGLNDVGSYTLYERSGLGRGQRYTAPNYDRVTTVSLLELQCRPLAIVGELVSPLLRSLGSHGVWRPYLTDEAAVD